MKANKDLSGSKQLLRKYLENQCTAEEEQRILEWYFSFDETDDFPIHDQEQERIRKLARSNVFSAIRSGQKNHRKFWNLAKPILRIAAVMLVICAVAFLGLRYTTGEKTVGLELKTTVAERKFITLEDGTKVWLGNASVLHYPSSFKTNSREVELEGEAFFKVNHNPKKPFLIHTRKLKIQVLGTSFNVRSYASDRETAVNVASGKVAVLSAGNQVMLERGQGIIYDHISNQFGQRSNEGTYSPVWLSNTLYFRYETLRMISLRLERWYGVKFEITDPQLLQKRYTLEQHNETLENVMKVLSAGDFSYQIKGKTVKIWK
ncbi:FecR family protein [Pedobacter sp.]|jgi:transmembrane sensor|uniref:FecR family protein n=1 Tax=Pedobacter sp. TaxID=1411316 RepID=UPI002CB5249D|nr:FecR family protein [Pedobacter sp.]HWW39751.1 FecR family protein [Pedobacter sp.]